jgi:tetratricopeptide (TPR) repeat protein
VTNFKVLFYILILIQIILPFQAAANDECPLCKSKWCCQCILGKIIKNIESAFDEYSYQESIAHNIYQDSVDNAPMLSQVTASMGASSLMHMDMIVSLSLNFKHKNGESKPKKSLFDDKSTRIKHWKDLETLASFKKEGSTEWNQSWEQAYQYANSMIPFDYHFNLNAAIALTRLGEFQAALELLVQQLEKEITDLSYKNGVLKQLGFIYYYANNFECSISYYQQALPAGSIISQSLHNIISKIIVQLEKSGTCRAQVCEWFYSLSIN